MSDEDDDAESASQESRDASLIPSQTPDTVILTKNLTQNLSRQDTQKDNQEKDTQDTVLMMSSEEFKFPEEERAPGFMEEYPGFLESSDDEG